MTNEFVDVPMPDGEQMPAYVVRADGDDVRSGLVLLQEIFGVNANMRKTAEAFASQGFDVIVPDLFWRQERRVELDPSSEADRARATALMQGLDQKLAVEDAMAAAGYLKTLPDSAGDVGAVGYCLGGKLAFLLATKGDIAVAVSYYGVAIQSSLDRSDDLVAPLLLHIAKDDSLCPPEAQAAIHAALDDRANVAIIDHPGVGHAFARIGGGGYDRQAAERADAATLDALRGNLRRRK